TGLAAILASLVLVYATGMPEKFILSAFDSKMFLMLFGVMYLFCIAQENKTLDVLARKVLTLCKGNAKIFPSILFLLGDHFFNVRIPEDHHVAVVAEPFVQAVVVHRPALDICLNRDEDVGKGLVGIGVKVLGVVKADECDRRHIGVIFARRLLVIGILDKMADRAALAAGHDIDGVFLAVERDIHTLAVHDVGDGKAGKIAVDAVALGAPAAAEVLAEPRVAPDNVAFLAGNRDGVFVFFKIFGIQTGKMLRRTANGQADICSELQRQRNDHAERQRGHAQLHIKQNEVVGSHERSHKQHDQPEDDKPRGQCPMFSFHSITCLAYICLFGQRAPQIIW
ncbi:MAG: hypothetical protein IIX71_00680, partial [Ruminococcus sp.]|nr:hypothetical protein [Ruminococcus sp.]